MTSIAIISDIHSNLSALRAVLSDIHKLGIKQIFCLGDLVGYYTEPITVIHLTIAMCKIVIKGNQDNVAALGAVPEHYRFSSQKPLDLANQLLTTRERRVLHDLPIMHTLNISNRKIMLIHGGPEYPLDQYIYPDDKQDIESTFEFMNLVEVDSLFLGHTHIPFKAQQDGMLIVNPGSVGQPRDGNPNASYLVYESENSQIEFHRVPYDPTPTIEGIKKHNFSSELAERLLVGR